VVGAARAAAAAGLGAIATLDMGGTSTDVAFHSPGAELAGLAEEVRVAGHSIAVPTLDMHTVGCGGGSLARVDSGGVLRVGPESAGADPGPVAFGHGGTQPTVTDAHVVLGRIAPMSADGGFLGGSLDLDEDAAMAAYDRLGAALGVDRVRAAEAVIDAANASMRRALGVMTMQRGRDPRSTPLVAFGGGGGLAAAELARGLGMPAALIPASPGVLSAHGMTRAERSVDRSASVLRPLNSVTGEARSAIIEDLKRQARTALSEGEALAQEPRYEASLSVRYRGQSYELSIPDGENPEAAFHRAHRARFGWTLEHHEVQLVHVRLRATEALPSGGSDASGSATGAAPAPVGQRAVVFSGERLVVAVHQRDLLNEGARIQGPAIVEEYSGTTVLPPGSEARVVGGLGLLIQDSTS
jgi:N-methylhydantoinase A